MVFPKELREKALAYTASGPLQATGIRKRPSGLWPFPALVIHFAFRNTITQSANVTGQAVRPQESCVETILYQFIRDARLLIAADAASVRHLLLNTMKMPTHWHLLYGGEGFCRWHL